MIDRSRFHFCLRRTTLLGSLGISTGLFSLLPAVCLLLLLAGGLAFVGCWLGVAIMGLLGYVVPIVGGLAVVSGISMVKEKSDSGGATLGGGVTALVIGGFFHWL